MKYRLKRDLPFAKAGDSVCLKIDTCYSAQLITGFIKDPHHTIYLKDKSDLENLISEGWIEEVKPREIWINEYKQGLLGSYLFDSKESAEKSTAESGYIRTVKFVEVVE